MKVRVMFKTSIGYNHYWLTKAKAGFVAVDHNCHSPEQVYSGFTVEEVDQIREDFSKTVDAYFLFSI